MTVLLMLGALLCVKGIVGEEHTKALAWVSVMAGAYLAAMQGGAGKGSVTGRLPALLTLYALLLIAGLALGGELALQRVLWLLPPLAVGGVLSAIIGNGGGKGRRAPSKSGHKAKNRQTRRR